MNSFTSIRFRNFKAFKTYSVSLKSFNILVGPNNSGKSTILGAFRILSEGIRKAYARKPEFIIGDGFNKYGYTISLEDLPIATENVFTNYNDEEPAVIDFRISNGNILSLIFPGVNRCCLFCETKGKQVRTPSDFKDEYGVTVGFVPVLGPVDHREPLYKKDAARLALLSHRASRNFRNIWYHYPERFDEFQQLIRSTWPGMDINLPKIELSREKPILSMFCPEERILREIYWAGFGFQVWCQMLTYIVKSDNDTLLVIDEPDIYLHSDLQRQLLHILKTASSDILIATHSTEIISEAEPDDLLVINKKSNSATRITDPAQIQGVFEVLGSNLNPTLTQLAKSRRAIFVEGKDFQILSHFARKLDKAQVANRSDFAVIHVGGFNQGKVKSFSEGVEFTLGTTIKKCVIFDRDYRSNREIVEVKRYLDEFCTISWIHKRKEIENYILHPVSIERAIGKKIADVNKRTGKKLTFEDDVSRILMEITDGMKHYVNGQFLSKRVNYEKSKNPSLDYSTINQQVLAEFDEIWSRLDSRLIVVAGKDVMSLLNKRLQEVFGITISSRLIIENMIPGDIAPEIVELIDNIERFRKE